MRSCLIRPSTSQDLTAMAGIYAHAVLGGTGSFEIEPPQPEELALRRDAVLAQGLPWLVAQTEAGVQGFAYATRFRPRPAYRFSVEDSVYVDPAAQGRGLGRLLLAELVSLCAARGARQMLAVIGDSDNLASIHLHRRLGFEPSGQFSQVGYKFGRWLDIVLMQRSLGPGAQTLPHD